MRLMYSSLLVYNTRILLVFGTKRFVLFVISGHHYNVLVTLMMLTWAGMLMAGL